MTTAVEALLRKKKKIFFALHTLVWKYEFQQLGISQNYLLSNTK